MIGKQAILKDNLASGLIVGEIRENEESWKIQFSYDSTPLIRKFAREQLMVLSEIPVEIFVERLLRDILSEDLTTRIYAAHLFCDFVEFHNDQVELKCLFGYIDKIIAILEKEENGAVGEKLAESVFEFIWLEKLDQDVEQQLIIRLARLNSDYLYSYLNNEEYLLLNEVKDFIDKRDK